MRYLLDTHSLIWFISGDPRLSKNVRQLMGDEGNELFISICSLWEMAVKFSTGKLILAQPFEEMFPEQLDENSIDILPITVDQSGY